MKNFKLKTLLLSITFFYTQSSYSRMEEVEIASDLLPQNESSYSVHSDVILSDSSLSDNTSEEEQSLSLKGMERKFPTYFVDNAEEIQKEPLTSTTSGMTKVVCSLRMYQGIYKMMVHEFESCEDAEAWANKQIAKGARCMIN